MTESSNKKAVTVAKASALLFFLWILWVVILIALPQYFEGDDPYHGSLRAIIRVVLWTAPVIYFARVAENMGFWQFLQLHESWKKGIVGGLVLVGIAALLNLLQMYVQGATYRGLDSISLAGWLNVVITAPILEEVFFRGVVFKALYEEYGYWRAATASSVLFVAIHLPYWILAGVFSTETLGTCVSILILGYVFCLSMKMTGSLITPTIGHVINNLLSILIR